MPMRSGPSCAGLVNRPFQAMKAFVLRYLDKFHTGQKVIICGHSLGGAIALLLAEALRRRAGVTYNILLYTSGAPPRWRLDLC